MALASVVLGVVGLASWTLCLIHIGLAFVPAVATILALVIGFLAAQKARREEAPRGLAMTGFTLGVLGLVLPAVAAFWLLSSRSESVSHASVSAMAPAEDAPAQPPTPAP